MADVQHIEHAIGEHQRSRPVALGDGFSSTQQLAIKGERHNARLGEISEKQAVSLASTSTILGVHLERPRALFGRLDSPAPAHGEAAQPRPESPRSDETTAPIQEAHLFMSHALCAAGEAQIHVRA
jgi:hypothetical protein